MNLVLKMNYNTVIMNGKSVKLIENYEKDTMVYRLVDTLTNCTDEAAVSYVMDTDYQNIESYLVSRYNELAGSLQRKARIFNTFGIETSLSGRNIGAGFTALVSREDYEDTVMTLISLLHLLKLDEEYELVSRFENIGVYAIVRK